MKTIKRRVMKLEELEVAQATLSKVATSYLSSLKGIIDTKKAGSFDDHEIICVGLEKIMFTLRHVKRLKVYAKSAEQK